MRVVVVDDQQDAASQLVDFLVELGHQPLLVRSAEAAIARLAFDRPDSIILNLDLPGMSGLEFLQLRTVRESRVPVIAVSARASEDQARESLRLGALDFIEKPIALDRLAEVLAYLELGLLGGRREEAADKPERRLSPRAKFAAPVQLTGYDGCVYAGMAIDLSAHGIKVRGVHSVPARAAVRLAFTPPDGGARLDLVSLALRHDPDGVAFCFANASDAEVDRLRQLIGRLLAA